MLQNKTLRYAMFGLLYFTQGTILSYFTALNALYLLANGLTMTNIGIFSTIALLPFVIKIFLGMLSDQVNLFHQGHRKPYILIGLVIQTLCLIFVPFINPAQNYWGFVAIAFTLQMGMALYDTCTDGLALDTTPAEEQGTIQGFMVGGRAVGVIVTASVVGLVAQNVSWLAVFWLLAGLTLLPLPLVFSVKEPERPAGRRFEWNAFVAFKKIDIVALVGVGIVAFGVVVGANQLVNPYLQARFQIDLSTAGFMTTLWGVGVVCGSAIGSYLTDHFGRGKAVLAALSITTLSLLLLAVIPLPAAASWQVIVFGISPLVFFFGIAYGSYQTVYFALAMHYTDPRIAASMFSILMAFTNVGQAIGLGLGGFLSDQTGFNWTFIIYAGVNLLALPLLPVIFRRPASKAARVQV